MGVNLSTASPLPDDVTLENYNGSWRFKQKVLLQILTFANESTKTSAALSGYDYYIIEGAFNGVMLLRMNGLSTNVYTWTKISSSAVTMSSGQTSIRLGNRFWHMIQGTPVTSYNQVNGTGIEDSLVNIMGNADLSTSGGTTVTGITVLSGGNVTGTCKIYGLII